MPPTNILLVEDDADTARSLSNALDTSGKAAIVYAASRGFTPVVARLIGAGVDTNRKYAHGLTTLMWAAG